MSVCHGGDDALFAVAVSDTLQTMSLQGIFYLLLKEGQTMKHVGTRTIETERLILRRFSVSDAPQMFKNWACDQNVTRYLTWPPHESQEFTARLLSDWVKQYAEPDNYQWCIELKASSQAIGSISVVKLYENIDAVEIGYCIGAAYWGRGIMTEALGAVIQFFFQKVGAHRIQAKHDAENPASGRVMQKCGMKFEGKCLHADKNQRGICDICIYGLVKK